jgi:phage gpG-like protein
MATKNFDIRIKSNDLEKLIRKFNWRGKNFDVFLEKGVEKGMMPIQRLLKSRYLSGGILNVQTGRLRSSVRTWVQSKKGVVFGIIGTNVKYAPAHEFGFKGSVSIPSHFRLTKAGKAVEVKAHSRFVNLRERAPFRKSIKAKKNEFMKIVLKTMMVGFKKK